MTRLVVLNYQREIPPFMLNELRVACGIFDKVYYITPELYNDNSGEAPYENLEVIQLKKYYRYTSAVRSVSIPFIKELGKDCLTALKERRFTAKFLKHVGGEYFCADILYRGARKILAEVSETDRVVVLAVWFSCEAYAAAKLKEKYPFIKAASFAHAFEINPERNNYVNLSLNAYKHRGLERISFISKRMQSIYDQATAGIELRRDIENVRYLGCLKFFMSKNRTIDKFHICSCAGMNAVKHIDLLIDALAFWTDGDIYWTHIGGGPLEKELMEKAKKMSESNPKVHVRFLGKVPNQKVQEYYRDNPVDLFINTSRSEGLPVSIMEAMAYGIPVLATDVGGTSEIVDADTGILIDKDISPKMLCGKIQAYFELNKEEKNRFRKNAFLKWQEVFDCEKNASDFYRGLIDGNLSGIADC